MANIPKDFKGISISSRVKIFFGNAVIKSKASLLPSVRFISIYRRTADSGSWALNWWTICEPPGRRIWRKTKTGSQLSGISSRNPPGAQADVAKSEFPEPDRRREFVVDRRLQVEPLSRNQTPAPEQKSLWDSLARFLFFARMWKAFFNAHKMHTCQKRSI